MAISLIKGEVIKNAIVIPNGIPAQVNPRKTGILQHQQKGVIAPKTLPKK
ncbi:MAG: hypothetical protein ACI93H_000752 [Psychromonas sp.]|jgi:hypothetical protein